MYAVGRIGSYITRGVYTVSGPFHPFGGAVDIIVVEQPDGTFKSSPWYVRFGKFQGVLKARETMVNISVNGVEADFHMYLNQRGEAFFLREEEGESGESVLYSSSSSDEADEQSQKNRRPMKSNSYNYDGAQSKSSVQIDSSKGKIIARTNSRRSRILGLMFGRRSLKEDIDRGDVGDEVIRTDSLERAEIAANLLELKWSTNLATSRKQKDSTLPLSVSETMSTTADRGMLTHDEQKLTCSPMCNALGTGMGEYVLAKESGLSIEMPSLSSTKEVSETLLGEGVLEEKCEVISEILKNSDGFSSHIASDNGIVERVTTVVTDLDSQIIDVFKECPAKKFDEEGASDKAEDRVTSEFNTLDLRLHDVPEAFTGKKYDDGQTCDRTDYVHVASAGFGISAEESGCDRAQSFIHVETAESLVVRLDGSSEQTYETLYVENGGAGELPFASGTFHVKSDLLPENTTIHQDGNFEVETECIEAINNDSQNEGLNLEVLPAISESCTHAVSVAPISGLFKDGESQNCTISNCSNSDCPIQFENTCQTTATSISVSESSEEEQFFFSDLDESKLNRSIDCVDGERNWPEFREDIKKSINAFNENVESDSLAIQENESSDLGISSDDSKVTSGPIDIPAVPSVPDGQIERLAESLPVIRSLVNNLDSNDLHPISHSLDSPSNILEWTFRSKDESDPLIVKPGNGIQSAEEHSNIEGIHNSDEKNEAAVGDTNKTIVASGGSWGIWPFSFRRSRSRKIVQPVLIDTRSSNPESVSDSNIGTNEDQILLKPKVIRKVVKAMTPTSEQLASLNLQEGRNVVTFTFSTAVLGKQKVDANIYLWKWNTRIVISDVDGTITRSDVLGQFMPLVGVDWSQTGVAHLFSGIKENGYQLLFLSARAISQAYITRQFLVNLKQDGKALPDGPVVISPDGLFPSLFREVIRRAPHEFKIACLEDIKALFPPDCNPFYAGFGNRDTDEISYLKVGIPRGKIFIINPKGEVAVYRRVDTKSYTSLHTLVHDMFPPRTSSEQEDYNSWNYWKLPPPVIDI